MLYKRRMQGMDGAIIAAVLGLSIGFGLAFFLRRRRAMREADARASAPKPFISRQVSRREERERMKAERRRG